MVCWKLNTWHQDLFGHIFGDQKGWFVSRMQFFNQPHMLVSTDSLSTRHSIFLTPLSLEPNHTRIHWKPQICAEPGWKVSVENSRPKIYQLVIPENPIDAKWNKNAVVILINKIRTKINFLLCDMKHLFINLTAVQMVRSITTNNEVDQQL